MIGDAPRSPVTGVPGWLTVPEEAEMSQIAREIDAGAVIEIGSEFGRSASIWEYYTGPEVPIYCLDIRFDGPLAEVHKKNLEEAGLGIRTIQVSGDSKKLCNTAKFKARKFSLLFVDGDHSEEGAYQDLINWTPKVRKGGYLLIHDCAVPTNKLPHPSHYDVLNAVSRWQQEATDFQFLRSVDSLMVFKRM